MLTKVKTLFTSEENQMTDIKNSRVHVQNFGQKPMSKIDIAARLTVSGAIAVVLFAGAILSGQMSSQVVTAVGSLPILNGKSALTELKQRGRLESIVRKENSDKVRDDSVRAEAALAFGGSTKIQANDGIAGDQFGGSVAISGTTVIVGANGGAATASGAGAAYVYVLSNGAWTLQQKLTANDGEADDAFGTYVAISGDTAVVGAYGDRVGTNVNQGSAYVFVRTGTSWSLQQKLTVADGAANDFFGRAVAIAGDTVVVGSSSADVTTNVDQGAAYVFFRSGSTWAQQAKLVAGDGAATEYFGDSVAISGDTVVVGATEDATGANIQQGSAYVFTRSGTAWSQQAKLTAGDGTAFDYFGFSVAVDSNTAVVGTLQDVGANFQQGSAYVFVRSGTTWTQQQKILAGDGSANDSFGNSVFVSGDTAMIGAAGDTNGANARQGSAYLFTRTGTTWTQSQKLVAADGGAEDSFGAGVAFTQNAAVVGSIGDTIGGNSLQGSAYIFSSDVSISGRVTTPSGQNLRNVIVSLIDSANVRRTATTSSFGIYQFDGVRTGESYTMTVASKRYRFSPKQFQLDAALTNVDFVGLE
ncbi:MAG: carboxypeptidase regulatory-like domain-containing protein [Pyrinomonadaceae bacterium]